jgi:hypothetical protein
MVGADEHPGMTLMLPMCALPPDLVNDVAWHPHQQHVLGSVGEDKQLILWDTRGEVTPSTDAAVVALMLQLWHQVLQLWHCTAVWH